MFNCKKIELLEERLYRRQSAIEEYSREVIRLEDKIDKQKKEIHKFIQKPGGLSYYGTLGDYITIRDIGYTTIMGGNASKVEPKMVADYFNPINLIDQNKATRVLVLNSRGFCTEVGYTARKADKGFDYKLVRNKKNISGVNLKK